MRPSSETQRRSHTIVVAARTGIRRRIQVNQREGSARVHRRWSRILALARATVDQDSTHGAPTRHARSSPPTSVPSTHASPSSAHGPSSSASSGSAPCGGGAERTVDPANDIGARNWLDSGPNLVGVDWSGRLAKTPAQRPGMPLPSRRNSAPKPEQGDTGPGRYPTRQSRSTPVRRRRGQLLFGHEGVVRRGGGG